MGRRFILVLSFLVVFLGVQPNVYGANCDQTLNPGANVASIAAAAAAGTTVCLNAGTYGTISLSNSVKSSDVTIQSVSGNSASVYLKLNGVNHFKFQNLTITGLELSGGGTKNITVRASTFTGQAVLNMGGNSNANILIDGNSFDAISVCSQCYEGRLQIISNPYGESVVGVTISNNHFGGPGESDGIQNGSYGVVIGPGNVFDGIKQLNYSRHVDSLQLYGQSHTTITGNYFINNDVQIMAPDGGDHEIITHNVFIASSPGNNGIQLGSHIGNIFTHNTVKNITVNMDKKMENTTKSQNALARDNILINASFKTKDSAGVESCTNCVFDHNLFSSSGNASGTNNLIGVPIFVGGANPTTWTGYQLLATSPGYRMATDGNDMGPNIFGSGVVPPATTPPPLAPKNLRLVGP